MVDYFLSSQPSNVQFVKWNAKDVKSKKSITLDNFLQTKVRDNVRWQALKIILTVQLERNTPQSSFVHQ